MSKSFELRKEPRVALPHAVRLERAALDGSGGPSHWSEGLTRNISETGLGIIAQEALGEGEVLRVYLPVQSSEVNVPVFTQVCWARSTPKGCMAGLQFLL
jgi:hypothetical protein